MGTLADLRASTQSYLAQLYWGTPISNPATGQQSSTFATLLASIFTCYKSAQDTPTLSGLLPTTFHALTYSFPFATGLECFAADAPRSTRLNEKDECILSFALTMAYYKAFDLEFTEARGVDGVVIPILQLSGLCRWILLHLWTNPSQTSQSLSKMLKDPELSLVDDSNKQFEYLDIPNSSLPEIHQDAIPTMQKYQREWLMTRCCILSTAGVDLTWEERNAQLNAQRSRDAAQNTQRMAMASAQANLAAYGSLNVGWNVMKQGSGNF
jgi:hypothetical protein